MNRATMLRNLDAIMKHAQAGKAGAAAVTGDLFGDAAPADALRIVEVPEFDEMTLLWHEQKTLGSPVSGHPVTLVRRDSMHADDRLRNLYYLEEYQPNAPVSLVALVRDVWVRQSGGGRFAIVTVSDETGAGEVTFYSESFNQHEGILRANNLLLLRGKVYKKDTRSSVVIDSARLLATFRPRNL